MTTSPRTSQLLIGLLGPQTDLNGDGRLSVGELVAALRNRAFGLTLLLFALPNILPIPGLPILFGMILAIIATQIAGGRDALWLPQHILNMTIEPKQLDKIVGKALPVICWIEKFSSPRFAIMAGPMARRIVGFMVFVLAILLVIIPLPWIGSMPQGLAIAAFGLGLTERDGVIVTIGFVLSAIALAVCSGIGYAVWMGAEQLV